MICKFPMSLPPPPLVTLTMSRTWTLQEEAPSLPLSSQEDTQDEVCTSCARIPHTNPDSLCHPNQCTTMAYKVPPQLHWQPLDHICLWLRRQNSKGRGCLAHCPECWRHGILQLFWFYWWSLQRGGMIPMEMTGKRCWGCCLYCHCFYQDVDNDVVCGWILSMSTTWLSNLNSLWHKVMDGYWPNDFLMPLQCHLPVPGLCSCNTCLLANPTEKWHFFIIVVVIVKFGTVVIFFLIPWNGRVRQSPHQKQCHHPPRSMQTCCPHDGSIAMQQQHHHSICHPIQHLQPISWLQECFDWMNGKVGESILDDGSCRCGIVVIAWIWYFLVDNSPFSLCILVIKTWSWTNSHQGFKLLLLRAHICATSLNHVLEK